MSTVDEHARHELYLALEAVLGSERTATLMALLPPVGWADVATKSDLRALEQRTDLRFEALEERIQLRMDARLNELETRLTRTLVLALVGTFATHTAVTLTAVSFMV